MTVRKIVIAVAVVLAVTLGAAAMWLLTRGDEGPLPAGQTAQVSGDAVTDQQVQEFARAMAASLGDEDLLNCDDGDEDCEKRRAALLHDAAHQLVYDRQVLAETERLGLTVSAEELAALKPDDIGEHLSGPALEDWNRHRVLASKLFKKLRDEPAAVDPKDVFAEYRKRQADFVSPEVRDVQRIETDSRRDAQRARRALDAGQDFEKVLMNYGIGSTVGMGGIVQRLTRDKLPGMLGRAVFAAPLGPKPAGIEDSDDTREPGANRGPVQAKSGRWWVFRIVGQTPGRNITYKQAYDELKEQLERQERMKQAVRREYAFKSRWRDRTVCSASMKLDLCKNGPKLFKHPLAG